MTYQELQAILAAFHISPQDVISDRNEQNRFIKQLLIDDKILSLVFNLQVPEQENPVPLYLPSSSKVLLELHTHEQVKVWDMLYALMCKRRFLLVVEAVSPQLIREVVREGLIADAALAVFADDYERLDSRGKKDIRIIDPLEFVQKQMN